ncbi:MAG: hypothetical protein AB7I42_22770 [Bradyrhizobium sp.]|uniref:hypothetical protein n=1 Tax=Bradyrhizobium sp. TaxID=376 RepID=UPI003D0E077F
MARQVAAAKLEFEAIDDADASTLVVRLRQDVVAAARLMTRREARYLVDQYYQLQKRRIAATNAINMQQRGDEPEPVATLSFIGEQMAVVEGQAKRALDLWTRDYPLSKWARSLDGVGPVIAAGLRAHLDEDPPPTVGRWWRFAGLDPTLVWHKGTERPWNAKLKTLLWKAAGVFVRRAAHPEAVYGHTYLARKSYEWKRNRQGLYADQAAAGAARVAKNTVAWRWYSGCYPFDVPLPGDLGDEVDERAHTLKAYEGEPGSGVPMLPPGHLHNRAMRYSVKLFLAHYHAVAHELRYGKPAPLPYAVAFLENHTHVVPVPNWPLAHDVIRLPTGDE